MSDKPEELARLMQALLAKKRQETEAVSTDKHKFWKTQPVVKYEDVDKLTVAGKPVAVKPAEPSNASETKPEAKPEAKTESKDVAKTEKSEPFEQGPLKIQKLEDVPKNPQQLPNGFEWCTVDVQSDEHLAELYTLLYENYIEDDEEQFRFKYPAPFLRWALTPPDSVPEFDVGVRASESKKLVAFISGIPANLRVRGQEIEAVEINFLCVHKQLRSKRLAPVLIKEVTRRVNLTGVWQALFTAGPLIPTPVSTAQYYHRVISWSKLHAVGFAHLPEDSTPAQQIAQCAIADSPQLAGFRAIEEKDLPQVKVLLDNYLARFDLTQSFSAAEMKHWFLPASKECPVKTFVVESKDGRITDFASFYGLESTVLGNTQYPSISIAYLFYYASETATKERLTQLLSALLVEVKRAGYDVLNALTVMDNPLVFKALNFKPGDGFLNYNLFNWKTQRIDGGIDVSVTDPQPGGVGVVLL